jgi:hypothetical protein
MKLFLCSLVFWHKIYFVCQYSINGVWNIWLSNITSQLNWIFVQIERIHTSVRYYETSTSRTKELSVPIKEISGLDWNEPCGLNPWTRDDYDEEEEEEEEEDDDDLYEYSIWEKELTLKPWLELFIWPPHQWWYPPAWSISEYWCPSKV